MPRAATSAIPDAAASRTRRVPVDNVGIGLSYADAGACSVSVGGVVAVNGVIDNAGRAPSTLHEL
jgi:hypothetical protein